jgi:hypothetical protein
MSSEAPLCHAHMMADTQATDAWCASPYAAKAPRPSSASRALVSLLSPAKNLCRSVKMVRVKIWPPLRQCTGCPLASPKPRTLGTPSASSWQPLKPGNRQHPLLARASKGGAGIPLMASTSARHHIAMKLFTRCVRQAISTFTRCHTVTGSSPLVLGCGPGASSPAAAPEDDAALASK